MVLVTLKGVYIVRITSKEKKRVFNSNNLITYRDLYILFTYHNISKRLSAELITFYSYLVNLSKFKIFTFTQKKINIELYNNSKNRDTIYNYFKILVKLGFLKVVSKNVLYLDRRYQTLKTYVCTYVPLNCSFIPQLRDFITNSKERLLKRPKQDEYIKIWVDIKNFTEQQRGILKKILDVDIKELNLNEYQKRDIKKSENYIKELNEKIEPYIRKINNLTEEEEKELREHLKALTKAQEIAKSFTA